MMKKHSRTLGAPTLSSQMRNDQWQRVLEGGRKAFFCDLGNLLDLDTIRQLRRNLRSKTLPYKWSIDLYLGQIELSKTRRVSVILNNPNNLPLWYEVLHQSLKKDNQDIRQSLIDHIDHVPNQVLKDMLERECYEHLIYGWTKMPAVKEILNALSKKSPERIALATGTYSTVAFLSWFPKRIDQVSWPRLVSDHRNMIKARPRILKHMTLDHVIKNMRLDGAQWCRLLNQLEGEGYVIDYLPPGMLTWINKSVFTNTLKGRKGQKRIPTLGKNISERAA